MIYYTCDICNKQFKTTQHLSQHKNRKKKCIEGIVNIDFKETGNNLSIKNTVNNVSGSSSPSNTKLYTLNSMYNNSSPDNECKMDNIDKLINENEKNSTNNDINLFIKICRDIHFTLQLKEENTKLKEQFIQLKEQNLELKEHNLELKEHNLELKKQL